MLQLLRQAVLIKKIFNYPNLPKEKINELRLKRLRFVLNHAYKFVPFYRRKWKSLGILPNDIKTFSDLSKLTITTKNDIIKYHRDLMSRDLRYYYETKFFRQTSGTSGQPVKMAFSRNAWYYMQAVYFRSLVMTGYNPKKLMAMYHYEPFEEFWYNKFGYMKKLWIPSNLSEEEQLNLLLINKPEYMFYYPLSLFYISKLMLKFGIDSISPKAIFTHGEVLSKNVRKAIERVFKTRVRDHYQSMEFGNIAWECQDHYHVNDDNLILEVIGDDGEPLNGSGYGSVILTTLTNDAFPLIRYRIGDVVKVSDDVRCKINFDCISRIEGRESCPNLQYLSNLLSKFGYIEKFQMKHNKRGKPLLKIEPVTNSNVDVIRSKLLKRLKNRVRIKFGLIKKFKNGKYI